MQTYFVYMLASRPYGTIYIGVTNDIIGRVDRHRAGQGSEFTRKYKVHTLVWFEQLQDIRQAIQREKTIKEWPRAWKTNLIERDNPHGVDHYPSLPGVRPVTPIRVRGGMDRGDKPRDDRSGSKPASSAGRREPAPARPPPPPRFALPARTLRQPPL